MRFNNTRVTGFDNAFIGMRNPLQSWSKSDSFFGLTTDADYWRHFNTVLDTYGERGQANWLDSNCRLDASEDGNILDVAMLGKNDLDLAHRLLGTGSDSDGKFTRYIDVTCQITSPSFWWAELDQYRVGTVTNSTSMQHTGSRRDLIPDDFTLDTITTYPSDENNIPIDSQEDLQVILDIVNKYRLLYKNTKDYKYFRIMRELLPSGYNYTKMLHCNYAVLRNMYRQRKHHSLKEWSVDFVQWVESLPYAEDLITYNLGE